MQSFYWLILFSEVPSNGKLRQRIRLAVAFLEPRPGWPAAEGAVRHGLRVPPDRLLPHKAAPERTRDRKFPKRKCTAQWVV